MDRVYRFALLALALVACNKAAPSNGGGQNPPSSGGATAAEADLSTATKSYDASASTVRDAMNADIAGYLTALNAPFTLKLADFLGLPDFFSQVGGLIGAQGVAAQANSTLPRGKWDCTSGTCVSTASDDYNVVWKTSSGKTAEIYLDWDGSSVPPASPTVTGHPAADPSSGVEAPTKLIGYLKLDGAKIMDLSRVVSYPKSKCVSNSYVIDVPDSQRLVLSLKRADGSNILNVKSFETTIGDNSITTKGDIAASTSTEAITAAWDLTTTGTVLRAKCGQYGGIPATTLSGTLNTGTGKHTLNFMVGANKFSQNPSYIVFTDSTLTVDGKTVKFSGSTQDTNKDGYIGDDLTIALAGGQTLKLADYLKTYHSKK